jgi:TRAP-type mannitol/chloroaromatic compound transport system permease small subunit
VDLLVSTLRRLVRVMAGVAGVGLLTMMTITCLDVVLRKLGHPLPGAYDLVKAAAGVTIACALPYTTAVKGHVAVEYFHHKLGRRGRVVADTLIRLPIMALFSLFTWPFIAYGSQAEKQRGGEHDAATAGVLGAVCDGLFLCVSRAGDVVASTASGQGADQAVILQVLMFAGGLDRP